MILELISVLSNNGASMNFEGDITFEDMEFSGVCYEFKNPFHIKGSVENISGAVVLSARVRGTAETVCARCMKPIAAEFDYEFDEHISNSSVAAEEDDVIVISGSTVDVTDIALNNFLVAAPMRYLCKPDCKGLCPHCGADRNVKDCDCEDGVIDPRLSALEDLFKN